MKLTVKIDSDNDALLEPAEWQRLLNLVGKRLEVMDTASNLTGILKDCNGNTVGKYTFKK
jgi:hypothetical protein